MNISVKPIKPPLFTKAYLLLSLSNLLMLTAFAFFLVFSLFVLHIGGDKADIGILIGIMPLSAVLFRPWVASLVDLIGRKKSYLLGSIIMALVSFVYQFFDQNIDSVYYFLCFLRFVHGVGFAFVMVAGLTFAADLIPRERFNEGFGMFGVTSLIGMALGPLLAEWIIYIAGYRYMFITATAICVISMVIIIPLNESYVSSVQQAETSFVKMLRHPILIRLTLVALCFGFGFSAHGSFVAPYAQSKGMLASLYFIAYSAAAILTRITGGHLADRFGEARIVPISLCLTGIGFITQLAVDTPVDFIVSGFITGTGHGMVLPCLVALAMRPTLPHNRGKANGVFTGGQDSGIFCGSLALGVIGERYGYQAIFATASIALFFGTVIFLKWRKVIAQTSLSVHRSGSAFGP